MAGLLVPCLRCGRQTDSSLLRGQVCLDCRLEASLTPLRQEHQRLWRKRQRYLASGGNASSVASQLARLEDRMAEQISALITNDRDAAERLKAELESARGVRYNLGGPSG